MNMYYHSHIIYYVKINSISHIFRNHDIQWSGRESEAGGNDKEEEELTTDYAWVSGGLSADYATTGGGAVSCLCR